MTVSLPYPWNYYADLQQRARQASKIGGQAYAIEEALNHLLDMVETNTFPLDPQELEATIEKTITSATRLHRSRLAKLETSCGPARNLVFAETPHIEARIELTRLSRALRSRDEDVLVDSGFGYTDTEIAARHASSPGAVRARLSRLRSKLADQTVVSLPPVSRPWAIPTTSPHPW